MVGYPSRQKETANPVKYFLLALSLFGLEFAGIEARIFLLASFPALSRPRKIRQWPQGPLVPRRSVLAVHVFGLFIQLIIIIVLCHPSSENRGGHERRASFDRRCAIQAPLYALLRLALSQ